MKVILISGSARTGSVNRKLAEVAADVVQSLGAEPVVLEPDDLRLPLFDQDLEEAEGLPAQAKAVKQKLVDAPAFLFCSPEYNSSVTPLLKNLIDWCSRTESDDEPPLAAYRGKVAGLLAASPGGLGGLRGLVHLRSILGNIGVHVVPKQFALSGAFDAFDEDGSLKDSKQLEQVKAVVEQTVTTAKALAG